MSTTRPRRAGWMRVVMLVVFLVSLGVGCGDTSGMTDEEKLARIEEMAAENKKDYPDVPELGVNEFLEQRDAGEIVLVDVRPDEERTVSVIPGAISGEAFAEGKEQYRDATIVAYCTIGYRSGVWAEELRKEGFDAFNLRGSILAWTHAGEPLVDEEGNPTKRVHVYGAQWDLAAEGYEGVW